MTTGVVPKTSIVELYRGTHPKAFGRKRRLDLARHYVAYPGELASVFANSVDVMAEYQPADEPFYRGPRNAKQNKTVERTHDVALRLEEVDVTHVVDGGRPVRTDLARGVHDVPASGLSFTYVDRELVGSHVAGVKQPGDADEIRMDLCLATDDDRTAVITEVKIDDDKDPFAALIQVLACAAQIVTPQQYERLQKYAGWPVTRRGHLRPVSSPVLVDLCIMLHDFPGDATYMRHLLDETETLAALLLAEPNVSRHIRTISCLKTELQEGRIAAHKHFAFRYSPQARRRRRQAARPPQAR